MIHLLQWAECSALNYGSNLLNQSNCMMICKRIRMVATCNSIICLFAFCGIFLLLEMHFVFCVLFRDFLSLLSLTTLPDLPLTSFKCVFSPWSYDIYILTINRGRLLPLFSYFYTLLFPYYQSFTHFTKAKNLVFFAATEPIHKINHLTAESTNFT